MDRVVAPSLERKTSVLITGYFGRGNLGDDLFKDIWTHIFNKDQFRNLFNITFVTVDDLQDIPSESGNFHVILIAGGDVLNYYFLTPIQQFIRRVSFKGKLCAFSVGIPYTVAIAEGLVDSLDFVMCRAKIDTGALRARYGADKCSYFPDISFYLQDPTFAPASSRRETVESRPLRIGVFLARTICKGNSAYDDVVARIAAALNALHVSQKCEVFLVPFNTFSTEKGLEDDRLINQHVAEHLDFKATVCTASLSIHDMLELFRSLDLAIAMRYHAHMYAIASRTPLVSLIITPKVTNLIADAGLSSYAYPLPLDSNGVPTTFDGTPFAEVVQRALANTNEIRNLEREYLAHASPARFEEGLLRVLAFNKEAAVTQTEKLKFPMSFRSIQDVIKQLVTYIFQTLEETVTDADLVLVADEIFQGNLTFMDLLRRRSETDWTRAELLKMGDFLAALACFALVQIPYPKYHFGMSKKILHDTFDARADFTWVWTDNNANQAFHVPYPGLADPKQEHALFDATFVGIEDFKGCHRSGWQYVLDHLMKFHSKASPLILDNYLDRTFHWAHDVYEYTGIIPFPRAWCGFIHHTFDEQFSPFNVVNLFAKPTFQSSLANCKGLFTLSKDLAGKVRELLSEGGWSHIPVASFVHPTEFSRHNFSLEKFLANSDKKVIMIGAWLRDNFAIYRMMPHESVSDPDRVQVRKAILRGRNMSNYFKPTELALTVTGADQEDDRVPFRYSFNASGIASFTNNKFALGLMRAIDEAWHSVEEISTLDNDNYDTLLSENVVFLKLVDASAVNTIIECIVRRTPVLVNRLPAVIEMLGEDYPFYYEGLTEAGAKVNHIPTIRATVAYLSQLDTTQFQMDNFIDKFKKWFENSSLG